MCKYANLLIKKNFAIALPTVENDFLVAQQVDECVEQFLLLQVLGVAFLQCHHHISARLLWMDARFLVFGGLVNRALPLASNYRVFAFGRTFLAVNLLVVFQGDPRKFLTAKLRREAFRLVIEH